MGLADGDERRRSRALVRRPRRRLDPLPDGGQIGRDNPFHSSSIPGKDRAMPLVHYRPSAALAASLSLALAACAASPPADRRSTAGATRPSRLPPSEPEDIDTEANDSDGSRPRQEGIGQGARAADRQNGQPDPVASGARHARFRQIRLGRSARPARSSPTGTRRRASRTSGYRVNVFILSRALQSDSLTVTVDRQERSADGQWAETTIARQVETDLENAILSRARQLKRAWTPAPS